MRWRAPSIALFLVLLPAISLRAQERQEAPGRIDKGFDTAPGRLQPIFVRFEEQLFRKGGDYERFCTQNASRPRSTLRREVLAALRRNQASSWKKLGPAITALVKGAGLKDLQRFWIVNGFAARAQWKTIESLARLDGVAFIYRVRGARQDRLARRRGEGGAKAKSRPIRKDLATFVKGWKSDAGQPFSDKGLTIPWNVRQIQAPQVWKLGYRGQGVVVALVDTGLLPIPSLTPALWRNENEKLDGADDDGNGYADDLFGWDFTRDLPAFPRDSGQKAHGSSCAGIIAGRPYNEKKFLTGIAPRARLMLLQGLGRLRAYEYALEQGADILSMSFMFMKPELGNYRGVLRLAHEHLGAGGIVACGGAGNFGSGSRRAAPAGHQIGPPKDIPCVLAAAGIFRDGTRSPIGSQGPCTWNQVVFYEDYPPAHPLEKPDVTGFFGGFPVWARTSPPRSKRAQVVWPGEHGLGLVRGPMGNSFSGPHAAAVAALVLSADPDLPAWRVQDLLRRSAKDLGPKGWDRSFGAGLLQARAAIEELQRTRRERHR